MLLWLACQTQAPAQAPPVPEPEPVVVEETPKVPTIGGAPILERPVVLGGIANEAIEQALDLDAVKACNTAGRPGKVLVKFNVDAGGAVTSSEVASTTLRHPQTEACVLATIDGTAFPALERGDKARVTWPFSI